VKQPPLYITTPIYYVNDIPHIGHAYTTVIADVFARYHRLFGGETFFLTGTDEHGQKVAEAAKKRGIEPQEHVDSMVQNFERTWVELGVKPDVFMRTTFGFHKKVVQDCLQELFDKGEIYRKDYEGWYSVSEEIFYTDKDLVDGKSPIGKPVQLVKETNYFFVMSKYQDRLVKYIEDHPDFIFPSSRKNEVLGFLKSPLHDLCISRPKSRLSWGIELPFDTEFVTYVWFDALLNYVSALGYKQNDAASGRTNERFNSLWPHTTHLIGKDILVTHSVYWPTMLMALGLPLPKQIVAHGWWLAEAGEKMSKSDGNVVSPLDVKDIIGVDPLRYYLVRSMKLGNDASFGLEDVIVRINAELANTFGNLISRVFALVVKYFDSRVPAYSRDVEVEKDPMRLELVELAKNLSSKVKARIAKNQVDMAMEDILAVLMKANSYLTVKEPWKTAKVDLSRAGDCLALMLQIICVASVLLEPVMPKKMGELLSFLGLKDRLIGEFASDESQWELLKENDALVQPPVMFPKVEYELGSK
jgi:methionyl-tRNA synthetase